MTAITALEPLGKTADMLSRAEANVLVKEEHTGDVRREGSQHLTSGQCCFYYSISLRRFLPGLQNTLETKSVMSSIYNSVNWPRNSQSNNNERMVK